MEDDMETEPIDVLEMMKQMEKEMPLIWRTKIIPYKIQAWLWWKCLVIKDNIQRLVTKELYCPTCDNYDRCVEDYKEASGYCDYYIPKGEGTIKST